jgi:hypothetical protein
MKLGTENKRNVIIVCILSAGALYSIYSNVLSSDTPAPSGSSNTSSTKAARTPATPAPESDTADAPARAAKIRSDEWHPALCTKGNKCDVDPTQVDPTLHLELLAKVQGAKQADSKRNLFEFGNKPVEVAMLKGPSPKIRPTIGPMPLPPPPGPPGPPPEKPLPPITAKYYGFASPVATGHRTGFFLVDGETILIKSEGEMVTGTYRLMKLNKDSVVLEDTQSKRQRTLPMVEDSQG